MAINGSIILNGVSDRELAKIWEFKVREGNQLSWAPNALQPVAVNGVPTGSYNNLVFSWKDEEGMKIVHEVLDYLLKKDKQSTEAVR